MASNQNALTSQEIDQPLPGGGKEHSGRVTDESIKNPERDIIQMFFKKGSLKLQLYKLQGLAKKLGIPITKGKNKNGKSKKRTIKELQNDIKNKCNNNSCCIVYCYFNYLSVFDYRANWKSGT